MPLDTPISSAFIQQVQDLLPQAEAEALLTALDTEPAVSIRYSRYKEEAFTPSFPHDVAVPWAKPRGYYLSDRPLFAADPLWHAGGYYVQEASSMLLSLIEPLLGEKPLRALDLCAAPGGKSTLLSDLLPTGSVLVSNEYVGPRAKVLQENIQKWGSPKAIVTSTEAAKLGRLRETFDLIVVDAPCSGEGMFRKDEEARRQWTPGLVASCASLQQEILEAIWPALAPGGLLVYSTCTFNRQEDEDNLHYLIEELGAEALSLPTLPEEIKPSPLSPYPCYRMMPHEVRGEGLFLALVRKPEAQASGALRLKGKGKSKQKPIPAPKEALAWINEAWQKGLTWLQPTEDTLLALPEDVAVLVSLLQQEGVQILSAGIPVAEVFGKKLQPHPALALSLAFERSAFPEVPLDQASAIRFLAREALTLPADTPRGIVLVSYGGLPLGLMKHLGNRSNNLYPATWRIRHPELLLASLPSED